MTLSVAVMHVPDVAERRAMLADLLRSLGGKEEIGRETTYFEVTEDRERSVWETARRAWLASKRSSATHHLVLQDDALVCRDFLATVKECIEYFPTFPISFFDMSKAVKEAVSRGSHWMQRSSLSSAVAIVMPSSEAVASIAWADANVLPMVPHDDARLTMYFQHKGKPIIYTAPCLVEHVGDRSVSGHGTLPGRRRVASLVLDSGLSGLSVDWSAGASKPHKGWSHAPSEYDIYRQTPSE